MIKTQIRRFADAEEFFTPESCFIRELSNSADDAEASIAQARVEPGVTTRWHRLHDITERYVIISGSGIVETGELKPQAVTAGDCVIIPAMCRQRIHNNGKDDLIFLAICTPRFTEQAYEDIDDAV